MSSYVSVCTLSVPPNSNVTQETGHMSLYGIPLVVECIPGHRKSGSESNENVTTSIQCNADGNFEETPTCEPKGKETLWNLFLVYLSVDMNLYSFIPSFLPFFRSNSPSPPPSKTPVPHSVPPSVRWSVNPSIQSISFHS